jgi:hypothetical protein
MVPSLPNLFGTKKASSMEKDQYRAIKATRSSVFIFPKNKKKLHLFTDTASFSMYLRTT